GGRTREGAGVADRVDGRVEPADARAGGAGGARGRAARRGPARDAGRGARGGASGLFRLSRAALVVAALLLAGCAVLRPGFWPLPPPLVDDLDADSLRLAIERTRPVWARAGDTVTPALADHVLAVLASTPDPDRRSTAVARNLHVPRQRGR